MYNAGIAALARQTAFSRLTAGEASNNDSQKH